MSFTISRPLLSLLSFAIVAAASAGCSASQGADEPSGTTESDYTSHGCETKPASFVLRCPVTGTNGWTGVVIGTKTETVHDVNQRESCKSKGVSSSIWLAVSKVSASEPGNTTAFFGTADPVTYDVETLATSPVTLTNLTSISAGIIEDDGTLRVGGDATGAVQATLDFRGHQAFFGGGNPDTTKGAFELKGVFPCHAEVSPAPAP